MKNVSKRFGNKQVLDGININVAKGESFVIIGGSGSGKSVTIKSSLGLITPDSGEITIDGENVIGLGNRERETLMQKLGMLFQGGALFDSLTVWENITFALRQGKNALSHDNAKELAVAKLKQVGLAADEANKFPSELSGGMQKRVSLARAIAGDPEIIFFDEPTTGLDPIMADVINDLIVKCSQELGATTITITHDMASVRKIASRVAMLYQGKMIWDGSVNFIDDSGNEFVDQFVHGRGEGPIELAV